jgi:hypothetical protein
MCGKIVIVKIDDTLICYTDLSAVCADVERLGEGFADLPGFNVSVHGKLPIATVIYGLLVLETINTVPLLVSDDV